MVNDLVKKLLTFDKELLQEVFYLQRALKQTMDNRSKSLVLILIVIFLTSLVTLQPATVKAQTKTIVVPDNYPTITAAIGNATNGDTILLRSGTYKGPINSSIVINKSISIIGENPQNTVINLYPAYSVTWILDQPEYSYTDAITMTADSSSLQDLTIQMANPGGSITATGNKILIAGNEIMTGQVTGVTIKGSNCRITNNVLDCPIIVNGTYNQVDANSAYSVNVDGSYNVIKDNTCQGLSLAFSTNNVFLENSVSTNNWGGFGVFLSWSSNNYIWKNNFSGFTYGIQLWYSSNNTIQANTVTDSHEASLCLGASSGNLFFINNFINNASGFAHYFYDRSSDPNYARVGVTLSTNIWSNGGLGNYWGNYQTMYPNATEGNSGTWNPPYVINDYNMDPYPLIINYDISTAQVQLPYWTNLNLPALLPTPTFPPHNSSPTVTPTSLLSSSQSPTPTPSVPEFSWLAILPLLVSMLLVAGAIKRYKHLTTQ